MPIEPPRLDDLTYDRVVADLVRRIPVYAPQWTDFNHSDPGVTLIQLFAQLAEQLGYRLNRMPEKARIELLRLLGVQLMPAHAARTRLAVLLADPARATAFTLPPGTQAAAKAGSPPPVFATWRAEDVVPAQVGLVVTTRNPVLHDVFAEGDPRPAELDPGAFPSDDNAWVSVRWDGKKPKDKDLPAQPFALVPARDPAHRYAWLGVQFNGARDAGFLGTRVTLHVQLDDDEQPTLVAIGPCGPEARSGEAPTAVDWLSYYDVETGSMRPVGGRIDDGTGHLARSGGIRFTVPPALGPIPDASWRPLQDASGPDPLAACLDFGRALGQALADVGPLTQIVAEIGEDYRQRLEAALDEDWATMPPPPQVHDLIQAFVDELESVLADPLTVPGEVNALLNLVKQRVDNLHNTVAGGLSGVMDLISDAATQALGALDPTALLGHVFAPDDYATTADNVHNWFLTHAQSQFDLLWGEIRAPNGLVDDLAEFYRAPFRAAVDALWASPAVQPFILALAQYYRARVRAVVTRVWQETPTEKATDLADRYRAAVDAGARCIEDARNATKPYVQHPLDAKHRGIDRVAGWIRIRLPDELAVPGLADGPKVRHAGFNVVEAEHSATVTNEVLGASTGEPGLALALRNRNVLAGTLRIEVQEDVDPEAPLVPWDEAPSLDGLDPFARAFVLDREAGVVTFGDGVHGRIAPLVPGRAIVLARTYRHGGGRAGEVPVGAISALRSAPSAVSAAVNVVAATGGRDAETVEEAEQRARKELSTRSRAVTADDFEWFARQTPEVRVGRAVCVPLRRALPAPGRGLNGVVAAGAVSVVVVPDERDVAEPLPTRSFLRAVCRQLDRHRLVTTELHVVPPQYCRLFAFEIALMAKPGFTRTQLQNLVEAKLKLYLHPLTGGDDGLGFPFGGQLHVADLLAVIFRVEGVNRVDSVTCRFARSRTNALPAMGRLALCPAQAGDVERVDLAAEECASVDVGDLLLRTVV